MYCECFGCGYHFVDKINLENGAISWVKAAKYLL